MQIINIENVFSIVPKNWTYFRGGGMGCLFMKIILCIGCNCLSASFSNFAKVQINNEVRTTATTTTMIIIINILMEDTDKMMSKILVEIERFRKEYVVLWLYHATFLSQ